MSPMILDHQNPKPFRLLDLPTKIRNRIHDYVLASPAPIEIHQATRRRRSSVSRGAPTEQPGRISALLRTCQQIRREAGFNTFVIPWGFPNLGVSWLESLAPSNRRLLRDVRFCYGDGAFWTTYDARTALTSLQMALVRTGAAADLKDLQLFVPVCEFSVHTWKELRGRDDASWVSVEEVRPFSPGLWTGGKEVVDVKQLEHATTT